MVCIQWNVVVSSLSHVQLFYSPMDYSPQAPLSVGFPRQEYQSGLPFPSPGYLPDPEIEPVSLFGRWVLYTEPLRKPHNGILTSHKKELNFASFDNMNRPRGYYGKVKQKKANTI